MSFVSRNHPQQVAERGALDDVDDRRTPPDLLAECMSLARVSMFDLDVAANDDNAVAPRWHTLADSGLDASWTGRVWCNPPYSDIRPWVEKADASQLECERIAMLLPANRTEQAWWQDIIEPERHLRHLEVYFLRGRRRFDRPGWIAPTKGDRPPFGLALIVWGGRG
jgi:phage N-6-adenine-methyltransferase